MRPLKMFLKWLRIYFFGKKKKDLQARKFTEACDMARLLAKHNEEINQCIQRGNFLLSVTTKISNRVHALEERNKQIDEMDRRYKASHPRETQ